MGGIKHRLHDAKQLLEKELSTYVHHLQSGRSKLTPQSAQALSAIVQALETTQIYEQIEHLGGLQHLIEQLTGGSSHGGHRQVGFGHHYGAGGIMPRRHQPMMPHAEMDMARRRYRTRSDMPHADYDIHDDLDIHDDYDEYLDMENARRRRLPPRTRTGRFRKRRTRYEMENDLDRMDMVDDLADAIHTAMRYANPRNDYPHADTNRMDMMADHRTTSDMPHSDGTRSDGTQNRSPMR